MKKTVNGLAFNTETAELLENWDNRYDCSDFNYEEQSLYVTKKGAYFIHGSGGGGTNWGRDVGNMRCGGQNITPLTRGEALSWCEQNGAERTIRKHFSDLVSEA